MPRGAKSLRTSAWHRPACDASIPALTSLGLLRAVSRHRTRTDRAVRRLDLQPPPPSGSDPRVQSRSRERMPPRDSKLSATIGRIRTKTCRRSRRPRVSRRRSPFGRTCCDDELADLYGRARVFAFLSEYEGFGHPPLEALSAGVPSSCSTPTSRARCAADAAVYVANGDIAGTTAALNSLLFDEDVRAACSSRHLPCSRRYSWARAAAETLAASKRWPATLESARRQPDHDEP